MSYVFGTKDTSNETSKETNTEKLSSIDDLLNNSENETLDQKRARFKFPKDFSFKNPEFRNYVISIYGRNNFNWKELGRSEKKRVRHDYQEKCKDYLVEFYEWPEPIARITSRMIGLPKHKPHKNILGRSLDFGIDAIAGSMPERYAKPIAKLMNENLEVLTKRSIIFDAFQIGIVGAIAYSFWTGDNDPGLLERTYTAIGVGKDVLKWWFTVAEGLRIIEVGVRTILYKKDKIHTPSPVMMFPINPRPIEGGFVTILFGHDLWKKAKNSYDKLKDKYSYPILETVEYTDKEVNKNKIPNQEKNYSGNVMQYKRIPSSDAKTI